MNDLGPERQAELILEGMAKAVEVEALPVLTVEGASHRIARRWWCGIEVFVEHDILDEALNALVNHYKKPLLETGYGVIQFRCIPHGRTVAWWQQTNTNQLGALDVMKGLSRCDVGSRLPLDVPNN